MTRSTLHRDMTNDDRIEALTRQVARLIAERDAAQEKLDRLRDERAAVRAFLGTNR